MGKRALATKVAFLDHLLGIVPRTTCIGHKDSKGKAASESAYQQAKDASNAKHATYDDRNGNGEE